ncbi:CsbD family protein [Arthrobacter sp. NPDC058288]|uniref:CsbD family protein n=1 Tax=Arthrobacter sp. NPDC058288 TaxID=3346424 RepID=UPI0036E5D7C5
MGLDDKGRNTVINHLGGAKEQAGKLTGNKDLQREGQADQARAKLGEAAETAKDAAADIGGSIKAAAQKLKDSLGKG